MANQVKDPYKQIWESRNLKDLGATKVELDNKTPEWQRGVGAFVDEMQGTGYGLAALGAQGLQNIVGPSDTLKGVTDWGLEGYNRNMAESQSGLQAPSIARVEDIKNASDAMDWASYQLGKGLPMLGSLALSGGIGGALGRLGVKEGVGALAKSAVGDMVKKSVVAKGLQAAEGQVVTDVMKQAAAQMVRDSINRGMMTGGFAGSFGLEGGQAFGEQVQGGAAPADAVKSAIAVGGINGALEFLPFYKVAKDIGLGEHAKRGIADIIFSDEALSKKAVQLAKEVGGRVGKGAAEGIVAEGVTEGLQELVSMAGERWAKNDPLFADLTKDDWSRISNAAAAGALVGGVAAGAGASVVGPHGQEQGQPAPSAQPPAASETQAAPGVQAPSPEQTRTQVLGAMLERANADIQKAADKGDTARVEELTKAKQIYEEELAKQQEPPTQPNEPVINQPPEQGQPAVEQPLGEQPPAGQPPLEAPPRPEAQPASPNDTTQLKQGETVVLSPDGQTRVVPTAEEVANLNQLMGERPDKNAPPVEPTQPTQPTEVQDGQAQAQTEALLNQEPQGSGDIKYSTPLTQPVNMGDEATIEEFNAVRKQFQERQKQETPFKKWFGQGTPGITADENGNPTTLYHGTNNPEFNQWDSSRAGKNSNHPTSGLGFFMTADQGSAARYGSNLMTVHAKIDNPYTLTDADLTSIETKDDAANLRKKLMDQGYDGAVVTAPGGKPYVIAFESKQVKFVGNKNPTDSPDFRYSTPAPFYSALNKTVEGVAQNKASSAQWSSLLDNMVKKGQVKQEEIDWTGIKDWLGEQKGAVSKEDLLNVLKENQVSIKETVLGDSPDFRKFGKWVSAENSGPFGKHETLSWHWEGESNPSVTLIKARKDMWDSSLSHELGTLEEVKQEAEDYLKLEVRRNFKQRNTRWTLPGGENQREVVISSPSAQPYNQNDTTHYGDVDEGRSIAWARVNDRVGEDGKKVLFVEEIQSKRHQEGKKSGYQLRNSEASLLKKSVDERLISLGIQPNARLSPENLDRLPEDLLKDFETVYFPGIEDEALVSDAPFKQTIAGSSNTLSGWAGLVFKKMLRYAVENGYDRVAWTTGEQQAERYDLAKNITKVSSTKRVFMGDTSYRIEVWVKESPNARFNDITIPEEALAETVGTDLAKKIIESPPNEKQTFRGLDLIIGGEGMKGFYDRLLPNEVNKYVKKWGAKVEATKVDVEGKPTTVHGVEITPQMRQSVMQGQPLFSEETAGVKNYTPETLRSSIDSLLGEGWLQQAESTGLIQVIDGAGPRGESGSYDGKVLRLYTKTMPKNGSPLGVLLHEGGHTAAFKDVLGNSINDYLADIDTIARNGSKTAQTAITHATIATANVLKIPHNLTKNSSVEDLKNIQALIEQKAPGLFAEEKMAYFIQYASEAKSSPGFLRRLINQIKAWFAQTEFGKRLKEAGLGLEINEPMAVEWAKASLQKSLADAKEMVKVQNKVINEASKMPASERVGRALEAKAASDPYYSIGLNELRQTLWTDPTDYRQDFVNKPGLLQKFRANFIDYFADIEKKAKNVYDAYSLLRNKKSALIEQSRQEYLLPLRDLIANSPWSAKEVGDMLAARHIKMDRVNLNLAERASDEYVDDLLKVLTPAKKKELEQARKFVKDGKNPDGTDYTGAGFDPAGKPKEMSSVTKRKLVFDLMNKYAPFEVKNQNGEQDVRTKWERFKDGAAGYSDGGITKGELRSVDDVLSLTSMDQAKFNKITNLFDAMNRRTLDILEEGKLITASEHARLLIDKSAYAPLRRESYNTDSEVDKLFMRAGQGGSKQLGTRTGTAELSEPVMVLQNALAKLEAAAAAAERNLANQELYHTVKADTTAWKPWFTIVDKDKYVTHDENGFLQERNATALNKADITLILDGKKLVIRPNMHNQRAIGFVRAVNNLDVQELSGPMKVLGWFNQITRWVNVSASPVFLMKNAIMDPFTAAYNIQASEAAPYATEIFGNYGNAFRALKKVFMDGNRDQTDPDVRAVEQFETAGGRTSFVEGLRAMDDSWGSFDAQVARRQGKLKQLMAAKDKWIDGIENFNILFENVMRFSTFQVLMEKGTVTESRAARIAQDLTTNFSRRGYKTQALGVWWLFFNATVQGNYQVVRNLMSSKRVQAMAGGTIALALALDLLGRALAPDDWDKIPENDKERNIIVPIKIGGDFIKIPAPWVYNVLWRMGGMLGETLAGVKKPQDGLLDLAAMTATTFNPVSGGTLAQTISPTAADPFVQILENKNFAGNPLGPEGFPGAGKKANSEMIWSNTPKGYQSFARFVNEATGGSAAESGKIDFRPADYQVLAQFLTGSLGKFLSDTVFGTKDLFTKGIEGPKDVPVIKQFFSDPYDPIRVQKYHTNVAGVFGAHKLQQMYSKGPDRDLVKLHEVMTARGKELAMYAQAQDVERQIKSLRARLKAAENREDTARVKELKTRIEKVQEKFNEVYKTRMG